MYSLSKEFNDALYSGKAVSKCEVLSSGVASTELPIIAGSVSVEAGRSTRRTLSISFASEDLVPSQPTDSLYPSGNELKVYRGVEFPDGSQSLIPLGVFVFYAVEVEEDNDGITIAVTGMDRSERLRQALWTTAYKITKGATAAAAIQDILEDRYSDLPALNVLGSASYTLPTVVYSPGQDPWTAIQNIATASGLQCYFDPDGVPTLNSVPNPQTESPVITYDVDDFTSPQSVLTLGRELSSVNTYNGVVASGEGTDLVRPLSAERWDDNPASPFYYLGSYGKKPYFYSSPLLLTLSQVEEAAEAQLSKMLGLTEAATWTSLVNPAHEVYDVVGLKRGSLKLDNRFAIDSMTIPLSADASMSISARNTVAASG